jgi:hypothetical protein
MPTLRFVFGGGKCLGFTTISGFPFTYCIPIDGSIIPNVGFPFGWTSNSRSSPTSNVFSSSMGSSVYRGPSVLWGSNLY